MACVRPARALALRTLKTTLFINRRAKLRLRKRSLARLFRNSVLKNG